MVESRYGKLGEIVKGAKVKDVCKAMDGERRLKLLKCLDKLLTNDEINEILFIMGVEELKRK